MNHFWNATYEGLTQVVCARDNVTASLWAMGLGTTNQKSFLSALQEGYSPEGFRSLGHVLHLLQDMGSPAHGRNDAHIFSHDYYELALSELSYEGHNSYGGIQVPTEPEERGVFLDRYFDVLRDFTSTRYFSNDTIFKDEYHNFPLPRVSISSWASRIGDNWYVLNGDGVIIARYTGSISNFPNSWEEAQQFEQGGKIVIDGAEDFWKFSGPKIIALGAGIIRLFWDELTNKTLRVPSEYNTIQEAIDASIDGNTILVANGTYTGFGNINIDFKGKAITLKSENGPNNCVINCEHGGRGFIFQNGEGPNSVISGITIANGFAADVGGGIYCFPTYYRPSPKIQNCIFLENNAGSGGGAIYSTGGYLEVDKCVFIGNIAKYGGAVLSSNYDPVKITNSKFIENSASLAGGAFYGSRSTAEIINCTFKQNSITSDKFGSAVYVTSEQAPIFTNCIFYENVGREVVYVHTAAPKFKNCTFTNNNGAYYDLYVVIFYDDIVPEISNSILWESHLINSIWYYTADECYGCVPIVKYSLIKGSFPGTENLINVDPLFVDSTKDFHLSQLSPCIDKGTNSEAPDHDYDGEYRPQGLKVDIGADEYNFSDIDQDRDIDGIDLSSYILNQNFTNLEEFTSNYGNSSSQITNYLQPPTLFYPFTGIVVDNGCSDLTNPIEWNFYWTPASGASKYHIYVSGPDLVPLIDQVVTTTDNYHF